ncbi:MAG: class I tRNA ligase family protein, partial [Pseudomonadota bacterium]
IDPLELIDQYGADATRYALASQEVQSRRTLRMSNQAAEGGRNFGTKLWNAARFAEMNRCYGGPTVRPTPSETVNKWIIGETARCAAAVDKALGEHKFNEACTALYDHVWKLFCDWYVEFAKPLLADGHSAQSETRQTMAWALDQCLILLHPIMPFITEELWETLLQDRAKPLIHMDWPALDLALADAEADTEMGWVIRVIDGIRSVRAEMNVPAAAKIDMIITGHSSEIAGRLERNAQLIERLARLQAATVADSAPDGCVTVALQDCAVNLPLAGVIDIDAEKARLTKAFDKSSKEINGLEKKLGNQGFLAKAPEEVIEEQRDRLATGLAERDRLQAALDRLAALS